MAKILKSGIQTLIEDLNGRIGYKDIGIAHSGFMDSYSGRMVNLLVGNDSNEAAIEIAGGGFSIKFEEEAVIAYGGSTIKATINENEVESYTALYVHPGDVFTTGKFSIETKGFRQYLAIANGIKAENYLGSKSTAIYGGFGGYNGRKLEDGDELVLGKLSDSVKDRVGIHIKKEFLPKLSSTWTMRAIPGPDGAPDFFTYEGMEQFFSTEYKAQMFCDRSGIRLKGPKPIWSPKRIAAGGHPSNITDHGYPGPGCVNISGDTLILFPCECPTSGGLICALSVIKADQWMMGQIIPGRDSISFEYCTQEEANRIRKSQNEIFNRKDIFSNE